MPALAGSEWCRLLSQKLGLAVASQVCIHAKRTSGRTVAIVYGRRAARLRSQPDGTCAQAAGVVQRCYLLPPPLKQHGHLLSPRVAIVFG